MSIGKIPKTSKTLVFLSSLVLKNLYIKGK